MTAVKNTSRSKQYFLIVIIIALLVILLPNLWQKSYRSTINIWQIPPRPKIAQVKSIKDVPKIKLQTRQQAKTLAWTLQLDSFANLDQALHLLKRLRAHGYSAHMRSAVTVNGVVTKVYVGPQIKQSELQTEATRIEKNLHLKGTIVPFDVFSTN